MIELLDASVLRAACPERSEAQLSAWVDPIKRACEEFKIDKIRRVAAFVATIAHECGFVAGREENLNYSPGRLAEVWPKRFAKGGRPNDLAFQIGGHPEKVGNTVYAGRMGNGDAASGDGFRFRGVGPVQLTGRENHEAFAKAVDLPLDEAEVYLRTIEGGVMSAAWFWDHKDLNELADTPGVEDETKAINGGLIGVADRRSRFNRAVARLLELERSA